MSVTWGKEMRQRAKAEGLPLIALAVDGRHAKMSGFTFTGPATAEEANLVWDFFTRLSKLRTAKGAK